MDAEPGRRHYIAVFVISLCLLMLEISFARLLSVVLVSHFAFVAVSLAMFGLGLSGLVVYLFPAHFSPSRVDRQLIAYSGWFGVAAGLCVFLFLQFRVVQELSLQGFLTLSLAYGLLAIPFFLGGICISLLMTHFSARMGRIYAADLIGASLGCLCVVLAMQTLPAPYISLVVAAVVSVGALLAAASGPPRRLLAPAAGCVACAGLILIAATTSLYQIRYIKNWDIYASEYAVWNSFSRVGAMKSTTNAAQFLPMSKEWTAYAGGQYPKTMIIDIDGAAWTPMMNFDGNLDSIQFLRESILYAVHHVRPDARVLLIGLGGGRDILAARAFGQRSIKGIEINPLMWDVVEGRYGDYSGHPYTLPGVEVLIDEARSRLHRLDEKFDIIQLSMIDTLSLNSAGGVVFSENNLYTVEAFQQYFRHLSDDGFLNLTRYFVPAYPMEMQRLAVLGRAGWAAEGIQSFEDHIAVLASSTTGTVLIKKSPYNQQDLDRLDRLASENNIRILYRPGAPTGVNKQIAEVITAPNLERTIADHEFRIHAPTDDQPFFWNFLRRRIEVVPPLRRDPFQFLRMWDDALAVMHLLIFVVTSFAVVFFFGPLLFVARRRLRGVRLGYTVTLLLYFACLGYGFLLIEIPLLQRFILLLGHPVYALSVVLFAVLLFSGLGSLWTSRFLDRDRKALAYALTGIIALSTLYAYLLPGVIGALLGTGIVVRIAATTALLAPIGLLMGMAYPLGINILRDFGEGLVPWAWGMNGVMSVVASVLATFIASQIGFTGATLTGVGAYGLALACLAVVTTARPSERT